LTGNVADSNWQIAGVGDLNGDGKDDIVWRNKATGSNQVWLMNGATAAQKLDTGAVGDQGWQIIRVADFDGDGKADLAWFHSPDPMDVIWLMNGATILNSNQINSSTYPIVGASWHAVQTFSNQTRGGSAPAPTPTPTATVAPSPTPTPTATASTS